MVEFHAFGIEEALQGANLIDQAVGQFLAPDLHLTSAEPLQIRQRGMGTHSNAVRFGQPHRRSHVVEIGGMETARHVRDVNQRHKARVVTHPIEPERFTHITIDRSHLPSDRSVREKLHELQYVTN